MRSFPGKTVLSVALATLAFVGCESVNLGDLDDVQIEVLEGDAQNGTVGAALADSVVVRVEDGTGTALPNMTVTFRVLSGGGSVQPTSAVTDGQGIARAAWTLGSTMGQPQLLEVHTSLGGSTAADTLQATARADAPAAIAPVGSATRAGPAGAPVDSLAARVTDRFGNPVAGTAVVWTVRSGGGTISPQTATTDASGIAKAQWTLGLRVDSVQVAEAAAGLTLRTEFTATTSFPAGAQLVKTGGDNQAGNTGQLLPQPLEVTVRLPDGRGIRGVPVQWSTTSGTLTPAVDSTDAAGKSTTEWRLGTGSTGTKRATATVPGLGSVEFTATIPAAPPFSFIPEGGDGQTAPVNTTLPQPLVVRVIDAAGRRVEGATVTWTVLQGGGSVTPTSVTDSEGLAQATWTLGPVAGQQRVSASTAQNTAPFVFTATATGTISVTISQPTGSGFVGDTLTISGTVSSARPVASVVASVDGRTVNMTVSGGTYSGTLVLEGLPTGTKELVVTATDVDGNQAQARRQFRYDPAPELVLSLPLGQTVARPSVQVTAQCLDDSPSTCRVTVDHAGSAFGTLNTTVTLTGDGLVVMNGVAVDAAGQEDRKATVVWVESSPRLQEVYTIPVAGQVCDVAGDSVVYIDQSAGSYQQVQRSVFYNGPAAARLRTASGQQTILPTGAGGGVLSFPCSTYVLVPDAVLVPVSGEVREFRNGTLNTVGTYQGMVGPDRQEIEEEGGWVIWRNRSTLYRRDPAGTVTPVAANVTTRGGQSAADVGANGDVVYEASPGQIFRVRGGVPTLLSGAATTARDPVTDGVNTVWHEALPGGQYRIVADTGGLGGPVVLSGPEVRTEPLVGRDYLAENGTIAFTRLGPTGQTEVWAVSPGTAPRQVSSPSASSATVVAVGPGGQVVYNNTRNFLDPGTGAADVDIGAGYQARRVLFRDGQLYVLLGRTVFRVVL